MKTRKRLVLLDTHAILHRAYHALPDFSSSKGEPTGGLYGLVSMLVKIITDLKPDYVVAAFDLPGPTHRHVAFEEYKAQRPTTDEALVSQIIRSRDVLEAFGIPRYECEGFEADDVIGTIVHELKGKDVDVIIASGDMDTMQLVDDKKVRVYTLKKGLSDTILYDEDAVVARYGFSPKSIPDYKGLSGDPSDNIPGVNGVGDKTASALIAKFGTLESLYKAIKKDPEAAAETGVKKGMIQKILDQEEQAFFSKLLAEIRLDAPIDFTLPEKEWREGVDSSRALNLLAELDFRALVPRVKKLLAPEQESLVGLSLEKVLGSPSPGGPDFSAEKANTDSISPEDLNRAELAVWVLDSNITTPTLDDVYRKGNSEVFAEALANLEKEIEKEKLTFVYKEIELPLSPVLRKMEEHGVSVDRAALKELSDAYHKELEKIAARIYTTAGSEFNINSPKQLGVVLFETLGLAGKKQKKTSTGALSTRESELQKLKSAHPIIEDILAHRELQKLLSTYIDSIPTLLDQNDRLHTSYIQTGTTTGRVSSKDPNLQNIPVKTDLGRAIRNAFIASPGNLLVSLDYSQIELRIAAILSGDAGLVDIFKSGRDVHTEVAGKVFHVSGEAVTPEQRRRAKVINFGILYGMGVNALKEALGTTRTEAQDFYNEYFEAFPQLARYLDEVKLQAARVGYTETLFGRRRHFEGINSSIPFVRASAERMAINAPMQGTQSDIIKLAMISIDTYVREEGLDTKVFPILQVHDELIFDIEETLVARVVPEIKKIMEGVLPEKKREGVPIIVEGKAGHNWGAMKRI